MKKKVEFHEAANDFPLLAADRLNQLMKDIRRHGLREPIVLYDGKILDGRNRYLACLEAGVEPRFEELLPEMDPFAYVWSRNGQRRDLAAAQRYEIWKAIHAQSETWQARRLEIQERGNQRRRETATRRGRNGGAFAPLASRGSTGPTTGVHQMRHAKAIDSRTNPSTVKRMDQLRLHRPDLADQVKGGTATEHSAMRQMKVDAAKARLHTPVDVKSRGLIVGDFRERAAQIPDASAELVFIDPPYDRESVGLYEDAARISARILKPGGSLIAYAGHVMLFDAKARMEAYLRYWWVAASFGDGPGVQMTEYGIVTTWKPMLWFTKGARGDVQTFVGDVVSGPKEKDYHAWQARQGDASYFIEKLTSPNGLVVDLVAGSGTTCVAAAALGRPWMAFEIDPDNATIADRRIQSAAAHRECGSA